jgi:hypothetical protein
VQLLDRAGGPGQAVSLMTHRKFLPHLETNLVIGHIYLLDHGDGYAESMSI